MKNKILVVVFCAMGLSLMAVPRSPSSLSPERKAELMAKAKAKLYERTGGYLVRALKDPRVIAFVVEKDAADVATLEKVASVVRDAFGLEVVIGATRPANAGVVIDFKNTDYPATFVVAPENGYGMLNVSKLKADNPSEETFKKRLQKEAWRTFVYALGGGNDNQPKCIMKPIATLKELDELEALCPCPMSSGSILSGAARFGVQPRSRVTYRTACEEGWAPAPTNDIQKAIWEKVHSVPDKPIKISYDKDRQKPVMK